MKAKWIGCFAAILFLVWPACACQAQSAAPVRNESKQADSRDRKEVEEKLQAKLDDLDREIKDLKDKATEQGKKASKEINQQLDELDKKRVVARRRLKQLEHSSQGAWEETKKGFDAVMNDLEETYKRAASHF